MLDPLWITYAWDDNDEGDFDYLVQELASAGVPATYDKIALVPGKRLWEQIGTRIMEDPLSGWSYLVTPAGLASAGCREELSYALQRVLETKGEEFPLIGLVHQVSFDDVPLALRVRVSTSTPRTGRSRSEQVSKGERRKGKTRSGVRSLSRSTGRTKVIRMPQRSNLGLDLVNSSTGGLASP